MNIINKKEKLRNFLIHNLDNLSWDGGGGSFPDLPKFDLYAQDYLEFAEEELQIFQNENLSQNKIAHLINCVSHLKRAMDCQLDTFFHAYNLYKTFQKRNLKVEKKLEFLGTAGIFSSRSLARLNSIRNKMEHSFEIPKIQDIEVYYDLISAFVAILQRTITITINSEIELVDNSDFTDRKLFFTIKYIFDGPKIEVKWENGNEREALESSMEDPVEFAYFLKTLFLIYERNSFASKEYILAQLSRC